MSTTKRLYRSQTDRMLAGVCGGLGEYFDIDPIIFRLIFVLLTIGAGSGVLLYILAWVIIPDAPTSAKEKNSKADTDEERVTKTIESKAKEIADDLQTSAERFKKTGNSNSVSGLILLVLGVLFLVQNVTGFNVWGNLWPLILIATGVGIILKGAQRSN
jgi:phage shock protein C